MTDKPALPPLTVPPDRTMTGRWIFAVAASLATVGLMGWGAFVTSIDAGLAVPDWPTSFDSLDPFNPWPGWWDVIPIRAEHGHRLMGALVGILTFVLMVWTVASDPRRWVKRLSVAAFALVVVQGVLGGLRVVWVSLDLAVVHACVAQVFFCTIVAIALFHSRAWHALRYPYSSSPARTRLKGLVLFAVFAVFLQIIFGALLRHPGTGIDLFLATTHMVWAFVVAALLVVSAIHVRLHHGRSTLLVAASRITIALLLVQVALGITAYAVNLDASGYLVPSNLQVVVNSVHMVVGALLMAATVVQALVTLQGAPSPLDARFEKATSRSIAEAVATPA